MIPVEINAGAWYLRALGDDDRISDAPALTELGIDDPAEYVTAADIDPNRWVWAVCVPTTGELVALIGVSTESGAPALRGCARGGYAQALADARAPVRRFAEEALELPTADLSSGLP